MRYVGVDLGDARTGLALGDSFTRIASPLGVVEVALAGAGEGLIEALAGVIEREAGTGRGVTLVVGLPIHMDGTEGKRATSARGLGVRLGARLGLPVVFFDERLTSAEADWKMARSGLTRGQKKARRDGIAAAAMLGTFLAGLAPAENEPEQR